MTQPIDSISRRPPPDPQPTAAPPSSAAPYATPPRELDVNSLPAPQASLGPFLRNAKTAPAEAIAPAPPPPTAMAQAKLDAYRATFAGPYVVAGEHVTAPAQFRMAGGVNDE